MYPEINISQTNPTTGWGANIFTAKSNEVLKVSICKIDIYCNYVIDIHNNTGSQSISQIDLSLTQSETISKSGHNKVPLNSRVNLNAGQKFSVVLELTNPEYSDKISVEIPISDYSSQATANTSKSFVSPDG
jgi:hypothetical protein